MKCLIRTGSRYLLIPACLAWFPMAACHPPKAPAQPSAATTGPAVSCRPDRAGPLNIASDRSRFCLIDVGSRNVKLVVASLQERDPLSMKDERQCRARLQLGDKTFDQKTKSPLPLLPADVAGLGRLMTEYAALCEQDGGRLVGAVATEWARRATNPDEIRKGIQQQSGISLEILSREKEGRYGYLAATRGLPGKIVLDFGSRSFQVSYWPKNAPEPISISVPIGIDEAGDQFFWKKEHAAYAGAREAFVAAARAAVGPLLVRIKSELQKGNLRPELFSLGENGDIPLALAGRLWDTVQHKGVDEAGYGAQLKTQSPSMRPQYGLTTAVISEKDVSKLSAAIEADHALFEDLRSDRIKRVYGTKMLAFPGLVALLTAELGLDVIVLVPQELPDGFIIEKLHAKLR